MKKFLTSSERVFCYSHLYRKNIISKELTIFGNSLKILENSRNINKQYYDHLYHNIALCFIKLNEIDIANDFIKKIYRI